MFKKEYLRRVCLPALCLLICQLFTVVFAITLDQFLAYATCYGLVLNEKNAKNRDASKTTALIWLNYAFWILLEIAHKLYTEIIMGRLQF